jgi:hypothetical protein
MGVVVPRSAAALPRERTELGSGAGSGHAQDERSSGGRYLEAERKVPTTSSLVLDERYGVSEPIGAKRCFESVRELANTIIATEQHSHDRCVSESLLDRNGREIARDGRDWGIHSSGAV